MLRLRNRILYHILSAASPPGYASTLSSLHLHRLISATPPTAPNPPFAVEDYLVTTCGLTQPQALKSSARLSHLKSASKPDAVLAFLADLGLSDADVAALVAKDPRFLCASVEKTLAPRVAELTDLGLSRPNIARLIPRALSTFRRSSLRGSIEFWLPFWGSFDKLLQMLQRNFCLFGADREKVVLPNIAFLRECGLDDCDIRNLGFLIPRLLVTKPERVRMMVAQVERVGVPRGCRMFKHGLLAVSFLTEEVLAARVENLKELFRWSDAEVGIALCKYPYLLKKPKDMLQQKSKFLISEVGLVPVYIARRPMILSYSLASRLRPRYYVLKFLKAHGLLDHGRDYYSAVMVSEKVFVERLIGPHKTAAPSLAEDYAAACSGEVPARFRFE